MENNWLIAFYILSFFFITKVNILSIKSAIANADLKLNPDFTWLYFWHHHGQDLAPPHIESDKMILFVGFHLHTLSSAMRMDQWRKSQLTKKIIF